LVAGGFSVVLRGLVLVGLFVRELGLASAWSADVLYKDGCLLLALLGFEDPVGHRTEHSLALLCRKEVEACCAER
jgi:hypothetical protein